MDDKPFARAEMIRIWTSIIVRVLLIIAAFIAIAWLIYELSGLILLLIISIFFCYLIAPVVRAFEQPIYFAGREMKIPRGAAIMIVYALMGTVLYVGGRLISNALIRQVDQLRQNLPAYSTGVIEWFNNANNSLRETLSEDTYNTLTEKTQELANMAVPVVETIVTTIVGMLPYLIYLVLVPILAFFLLKDAGKIEQGLVGFMPTERLQKRVRWLLLDVSRTLAAYIRAQITACIEIGTLVTLGLMILGAPYALVLGFVSGVLEFFPMVGPLIGGATAVTLALVTVGVNKAIAVAVFLVVLRIVQDYIIYPRIVGQGIEMHPLVVILAVIGGHEVYGLIGVFLSIPLVAMMMVAYRHYVTYRGIEGMRRPGPVEPGEPQPDPQLVTEPGAAPALEK